MINFKKITSDKDFKRALKQTRKIKKQWDKKVKKMFR